jgi:hypothetical protein
MLPFQHFDVCSGDEATWFSGHENRSADIASALDLAEHGLHLGHDLLV